MRSLKRLFAILFPVYNRGQAACVLAVGLFLGVVAIFGDAELARNMGIGAYGGIVVSQWLLGIAPDEMRIEAQQVGRLAAELDSSPNLVRIGDRLWALKRYPSDWWKSDRIAIVQEADGGWLLKARRRDLKILRERLAADTPAL